MKRWLSDESPAHLEIFDLAVVLLKGAADRVLELIDVDKVREEGEDVLDLEQTSCLLHKRNCL